MATDDDDHDEPGDEHAHGEHGHSHDDDHGHAHTHGAHAHAHATAHAHGGHGHGLAHVAAPKILLGTWVALMILTLITVTATKIDLGASYNLAVAMAIAVVKATLVVLFFMHLRYDKLFHSVLVVGGLLAASLFVGFALMDSGQYQQTIIWDPTSPPPAPVGPLPVP
jgi:cytochrome c oxidase subunit IV